MRYTFRFRLFGKNVQIFSEGRMGVVVEKEPGVVCVYGTDENNHILCAVPLCHPRLLKGAEYTVEFCEGSCARICVGALQIVIDYSRKKCANNQSLPCYGSEEWGRDVRMEWSEASF